MLSNKAAVQRHEARGVKLMEQSNVELWTVEESMGNIPPDFYRSRAPNRLRRRKKRSWLASVIDPFGGLTSAG